MCGIFLDVKPDNILERKHSSHSRIHRQVKQEANRERKQTSAINSYWRMKNRADSEEGGKKVRFHVHQNLLPFHNLKTSATF